jgi:hypothetical protein
MRPGFYVCTHKLDRGRWDRKRKFGGPCTDAAAVSCPFPVD